MVNGTIPSFLMATLIEQLFPDNPLVLTCLPKLRVSIDSRKLCASCVCPDYCFGPSLELITLFDPTEMIYLLRRLLGKKDCNKLPNCMLAFQNPGNKN